MESVFHSTSGMIPCRGYTSAESVAEISNGGTSRLLSRVSLASSIDKNDKHVLRAEMRGIDGEHAYIPCVGSPTAPLSMPSITKPMTPSMALTSTRFRSLARMFALAFLVPKVSPNAFLASRDCKAEGAEVGVMDFRAFTVRVKICGDFAVGRMLKAEVRRLCTATMYLVVN